MAWRLADLDAEVSPGSADRVHLHLHGVSGGRSLRRERAVHDGTDRAPEVSGAHHFRDGLVFLPGERGGYLGLNTVLGNRRRVAELTWALQPAMRQPPAATVTMKAGTCPLPLSMQFPPVKHAITPKADRARLPGARNMTHRAPQGWLTCATCMPSKHGPRNRPVAGTFTSARRNAGRDAGKRRSRL